MECKSKVLQDLFDCSYRRLMFFERISSDSFGFEFQVLTNISIQITTSIWEIGSDGTLIECMSRWIVFRVRPQLLEIIRPEEIRVLLCCQKYQIDISSRESKFNRSARKTLSKNGWERRQARWWQQWTGENACIQLDAWGMRASSRRRIWCYYHGNWIDRMHNCWASVRPRKTCPALGQVCYRTLYRLILELI